jgi:hypothetical protein
VNETAALPRQADVATIRIVSVHDLPLSACRRSGGTHRPHFSVLAASSLATQALIVEVTVKAPLQALTSKSRRIHSIAAPPARDIRIELGTIRSG